jgi:putative radical SAM enzyme (TIGR03279 family)
VAADRQGRADYAPSEVPGTGAWIAAVDPGSPADDAGLEPGMRVDSVNGQVMVDIITWRWEASDDTCELVVTDPTDGQSYECTLYREPGQDWGLSFTDVLFDGIRTCRNACLFCFMNMLPPDSRPTLSLRDDDYRLSFLQGNFVTLTNLTDADVDRIIACDLGPMNVSLHAISPDVRRNLIGRNAPRGIEVLERLCEADIEVHAQIVVCPGINDGDELSATLDWIEPKANITSVALVPLGYTKYNARFHSSFSDDAVASRGVVDTVGPYQRRSRTRLGTTRFQLSDEFYLDAGVEVPPADSYDGYPQFYDGIGMLRSFMDETDRIVCDRHDDIAAIGAAMRARGLSPLLVSGEAALGVCRRLADAMAPDLELDVTSVRNDYFGGDVNVTGLIVAADALAQLPRDLGGRLVVLPSLMFNFDGVTLDGVPSADLGREIGERGGGLLVCDTTPTGLVDALCSLAGLG